MDQATPKMEERRITMGWFAIVTLVVSAIPVLISLIKLVEDLIQGTGLGSIKKEDVLAGMEAFWKSAQTSGIGEKVFTIPWESVKGIIGILIDVVVTILNVTGVFKKEVTVTPTPTA
jgi:hypothetical protein